VHRARVFRDIYYIASGAASAMAGRTPEEEYLGFPLEDGQYFMLGDNSSASKDSRAWERLHHVDRRLIIGRAVAMAFAHEGATVWATDINDAKLAELAAMIGGGAGEVRRCKAMVKTLIDDLAISTFGTPLRVGDELVVASGDYAGTWTIDLITPNLGSTYDLDVVWTRLADAGGQVRR
jgi:hypothetical protein